MKSILPALLVAVVVAASATALPADPFYPELQHDPLFDQETYQKVRDITVDVGWTNTPLKTVMRDLTLATRSTHPIHADINFRISSEAAPAFREQPVSLSARGIPIYQLLEQLSQQAGFTIDIRRDLVLLLPKAGR